MITIQEYLIRSKEYSRDILDKPVHLVIGNESCDLDSMVSCVALAYFYHLTKYKDGHTRVIPIMNVASSEFPVRTLNVYELDKYEISADSLVFIDELEFEKLAKNQELNKVSLVDHHVLTNGLKVLKPFVTEIFDHRPVDGTEIWEETVNKNIQLVGSCSTLVVQQYFNVFESYECFRDVFHLIKDTIIFDTIALNPEVKKVTPADVNALKKMEEISGDTSDYTETYNRLWKAYSDVSKLTTAQFLIKDLKSISSIFIPVLPMLVRTFLQRNGAKAELDKFHKEKDAKLLVLMGIETTVGVKRDIALFSGDRRTGLLDSVGGALLESNCRLEEEECGVPNVVYFKQGNVECSRKQVMPIIKNCVDSKGWL